MTLTLACAVRSVIEMLQKHNTQLESLMGDDEWVPETWGSGGGQGAVGHEGGKAVEQLSKALLFSATQAKPFKQKAHW